MIVKRGYIIFYILLLSIVPQILRAQDGRKVYSIHLEETTLREVFNQLEMQSGLSFSYSGRVVDDQLIRSFHGDELSLEDLLTKLFRDQKIEFMFVEEQIVLKRRRRKHISNTKEDVENSPLAAQYTINGFVRDYSTGEILIGATIAVNNGSEGAISNRYGFFSLTLNKPVDSLLCSYIGYIKQTRTIGQVDLRTDFKLVERHTVIEEVVIIAEETEDIIKNTRSSEQRIRPESVRKMPALFGEKDVIKSLAAIPGVKFFGDGSTIFYVRGGSRDQNLITIDEAPVYSPTHLLGLFSTVVPDAVKEIQVYKGDFPAKYGGRLSSLVDIRTKDGNMQQFGMDASVGLLSSKLSLEGPLWKDHISYFISGRRSHILKTIQRNAENLKDLHFADLHFKLNYRINDKNRIFFSVYNSVDNYEAIDNTGKISGINWQNATATFRWNHLFSDKLFSNTTMYASRYDTYLNMNLLEGDYWNSHIDNFSLNTDFTWFIGPSNTLRFGARLAEHFINPGNYYENNSLLPLPYVISTKRSNESNLYLSDQVILSSNLSLRAGLRITAWSNVGPAVEYSFEDNRLDSSHHGAGQVYNTYFSLDPRLGLIYRMGEHGLAKFSYSRTSQFEHLITNSISPFTTLEVWLPSGPQILPQRADQLTMGYSHVFSGTGLKADAEFYYKKMNHQIDYRDHAKLLMNPFVENELRFGTGKAYGLETMLSRKYGKLNGWISYTYSKSVLTIEDINMGNPYPSYGDRPHDLSVFISYKITPFLDLSGNFVYMTGAPFTTPTAFYYYENYQVPIYFKRNNDRLPDYHRMDLALNWDLRKKEGRFDHELIFSIYNVYARKNPVAIHFNKIENKSGQLVVPYNYYETPELTPTQFYIYRMVPSLSYHFSF
jgi:hypothetical protein